VNALAPTLPRGDASLAALRPLFRHPWLELKGEEEVTRHECIKAIVRVCPRPNGGDTEPVSSRCLLRYAKVIWSGTRDAPLIPLQGAIGHAYEMNSHRGGSMCRRTMNLATWCLLVLAVSLYTASFFLPAVRLLAARGAGKAQRSGGTSGYVVFRLALSRRLPSWFGNVAFASGVLLLAARRARASAVVAALGLALAFSAIPLKPVEGDVGRLTTGYWVWATANAILLWACCVDRHARRLGRASAS
jgi:hypothetical protein